jgi:hypothetical protein
MGLDPSSIEDIGRRIDLEASVDLARQETRGDAPRRQFVVANRLDVILAAFSISFLVFFVLMLFVF